MVDGSSEDMLNKLLSKDLAGEVRLKVGRQKARASINEVFPLRRCLWKQSFL